MLSREKSMRAVAGGLLCIRPANLFCKLSARNFTTCLCEGGSSHHDYIAASGRSGHSRLVSSERLEL